MWTRQHKQRNTGRLIIPSLCVAFLAYFGFHAYHGEFGIYSKYRLEAETVDLQSKLDAVKARRTCSTSRRAGRSICPRQMKSPSCCRPHRNNTIPVNRRYFQ